MTADHESEPTVLPSIFHERYLDFDDDMTVRLRLSAIQLDNDDSTDLKRWSSEIYVREDTLLLVTLLLKAVPQGNIAILKRHKTALDTQVNLVRVVRRWFRLVASGHI